MAPIRVQTPAGDELVFSSPAELASASRRGEVRADWKVFHERRNRWLPITMHPAFKEPDAAAESLAEARRSSELVLIYPDQELRSRRSPPADDVLDRGPLLTPEEIERALRSGSRWPKVELPGGIAVQQHGECIAPGPETGAGAGATGRAATQAGRSVFPAITRAVNGVVSLAGRRR